jgi:hypothetical protein
MERMTMARAQLSEADFAAIVAEATRCVLAALIRQGVAVPGVTAGEADRGGLRPLSEAAEWFPCRNGRKPTKKTLLRRVRQGARGVRLRAVLDGGRRHTRREWVEEFLQAQTEASLKMHALADRLRPRRPSERARNFLRRRYGFHADK